MKEEGLTFEEAAAVVRASSVFTTHTPVEAGNERFSREIMEHYFSGFIKRSGLSWVQFWELGRRDGGEEKNFFMNILAFKMTIRSNAVSLVHGQVSRRMWRDVPSAPMKSSACGRPWNWRICPASPILPRH